VVRSLLLDDCQVHANARIVDSVLGQGCIIGPGVFIEGSILGDGAILEGPDSLS
jgi:NDP-sugar pyrophosphorylase family protein